MKSLEPTDKAKNCMDILIDAQMDIRSYLTEPLEPGRLLEEVLRWYKITEQKLYHFRYIKVRRLYMFLLHEACFWNYEKIAEETKCKNELVAIQHIEKIKEAMRKDRILLAEAGGIVERLKSYSELYPEEK